MINLIKTLALGTLLGISLHVSAQDTDLKAKSILDKLSAKTKAFSSISASFNSVLDNKKANLKINQKGVIKLKGSKYCIDLDDYLVINNGVTSWTYTKETNEVQVDNAKEMKGGNAIDPSELFTIWEKGFKYKYDSEKIVGGQKCDIIKLYPKDAASKNFHTIILAINKAKMEVQTVEVLGKGGDNYKYSVTKFSPNLNLADGEFNFEKAKYPGVDVIDNR